MRRTLCVIGLIFAALAGCDSSPDMSLAMDVTGSPSPDPATVRDPQVAKIYEAAKRRDERTLLDMRATIAAVPKATPDPAIALALFTIDREKYRSDFVAAYPQEIDGVNNDYGARFARVRVVPKGTLFPILALGGIATSDAVARDRLLHALAVATGSIATAYAREAAHDLNAISPGDALTSLAALPPAERTSVTSEVDWCGKRPDKILAFSPTPLPIPSASPTAAPTIAPTLAPGATPMPSPTPVELLPALVQQQIRTNLTTCGLVAENARRPKKRVARPKSRLR